LELVEIERTAAKEDFLPGVGARGGGAGPRHGLRAENRSAGARVAFTPADGGGLG